MEREIVSGRSGSPTAKRNPAEIPLLRAFAPLHRTAMGVAWGVVMGGVLAVATMVPVIEGNDFLSFGLLAQFFWGYSVSWRGVFVALLWGFGVGFALGYGFALIRNAAIWLWLTVIRSRAEMDQYSDLLDHL